MLTVRFIVVWWFPDDSYQTIRVAASEKVGKNVAELMGFEISGLEA